MSLARFASRLRDGGLAWLWRRIAFEAASPTTTPGKALHRVARRSVSIIRRPMRRGDPGYTRTLLAFYDLKVAPVTFDFLWFLVGAELARRAARADKVHVVIVPGPHDRVRRETDDYEAAVTAEARWLRVSTSSSLLQHCCRTHLV